jgi:hypothetical protein
MDGCALLVSMSNTLSAEGTGLGAGQLSGPSERQRPPSPAVMPRIGVASIHYITQNERLLASTIRTASHDFDQSYLRC